MKKTIGEYLSITLGIILLSSSIQFFFAPSHLAAGGTNGLAIIIHSYYPSIPVGGIMMVMNVILFIIAFITIGPQFGVKTIFASFGLSGVIMLFEKIMPISKPITNDLFLNAIFGSMLCSIGLGIIFNQNASTGGTDIIGKILNKFFNIELGKAQLISDFFITLWGTVIFGVNKGMYALLCIILNGVLIDIVIKSLNTNKRVLIISDKSGEIKNYIINEVRRGVTIYDAKGGYTEEPRQLLHVVLTRKDLIKLKSFVKAIDPNAFITVDNVNEVFGQGFKAVQE